MIKKIGWHLFIATNLIFGFASLAQAEERVINLEWEAAAEARGYQLEFGKAGKGTPFKTLTNVPEARWSGPMPAGKYWMRVRGKDIRGIYGDWSEAIPFEVKLKNVDTIFPEPSHTVTTDDLSYPIRFQWQSQREAEFYILNILSESGELLESIKTQDTLFAMKLDSSKKYKWFVQATDSNGAVGEKPTNINELTIIGPSLPMVEFKKPASPYLREIEFNPLPDEASVSIQVYQYDPTADDYQFFTEVTTQKKATMFSIQEDWTGGQYKLVAAPNGLYRKPTEPTEMVFELQHGDRSIASAYDAYVKESSITANKPYLTASYSLSQFNYKTKLVSDNRSLNLNAITSTGAVGYGAIYDESSHGYFVDLQFTGLNIDEKKYNFMSSNIFGIFNVEISEEESLRLKLGLFLKQLPEVTSIFSGTQLKAISTSGPQIDLGYREIKSNKWAIDYSFNYLKPINAKSTAGNELKNVNFYQLNIQSSYKSSKRLTTIAGYSYNKQSFSFDDKNEKLGASSTSTFDLSGHYLSLGVEYDY
ncbi:MAG: hypothetical protein RJB66_119 [Pseudomonadota bacterium]|jgi:hypothetical protein